MLPPLRMTFEAALRDAGSTDAAVRHRAAERLGEATAAEARAAVDRLLDLTGDDLASIRERAVDALGFVAERHSDEADLLIEEVSVRAFEAVAAATDDPHSGVREAAIVALGRIGGAHAVDALAALVSSEHAEIRFQVAVSIAAISPAQAPGFIAPLLADDDPRVRANAVAALASTRAASIAELVAPHLDDANVDVRREAALALAEVNDARGVDVLIESLSNPERAIAAAVALGTLRAEAAREPLARIATRRWFTSLHLRAATSAALAALGDERGVAGLRTVVRAIRSEARGFAAELAGRFAIAELTTDLAALVDRPRGADPGVVLSALAQLAAKDSTARGAVERAAAGDGETATMAKALLAQSLLRPVD
jgi:HEAT repeat protein